MNPSSREMQGMASSAQIALQDLQNGQRHHHHQQIQNPSLHGGHFDHASDGAGGGTVHDDFLDQMLSNLPSGWTDLGNSKSPWDLSSGDPNGSSVAGGNKEVNYAPYDESSLLAARLRQHQISGGSSPGVKPLMLQLNNLQQGQQMLLQAMGRSPTGSGHGDSGLLLPLTLGSGGAGEVDTPFKSPSTGGEGLYNGLGGTIQRPAQAAARQQFHHAQQQTQNYGGAPSTGVPPPSPAAAAASGGGAAPPRQRVRARRGQATDPHSIAERLRREKIAERMKALQELVPNANKTDKASMLDEIIDYVKFLQLQVKVLSMSRLGGAAAVAPLVVDASSEGQGGGAQRNGGSNGFSAAAGNDGLTVTEQQVAKLMEEDMGSAMQYLQGKGLCLMPISLASAISSSTCHARPPSGARHAGNPVDGAAPSSPNMSVLTALSPVANGCGGGGGGRDGSRTKDAASVSKP